MNNKKTGKLIKELRTEKGMTQKELAEKIQVSNAAVSKWENGHGFPDISLLEPLSETLNISIAELINGERSFTPQKEEETTLIKDIIQLSESERKRRVANSSLITGIFSILILILGCSGIQYLWYYQNEPLPIPIFLPAILPLLFVVPTVGLMVCWDMIKGDIVKIAVLIVATTLLTFGVAGILTKAFCKGGKKDG